MGRLTVTDDLGNWGMANGYPIIKVPSELYGALCKLKDYENTGLEPEQIEQIVENTDKVVAELEKLYQKYFGQNWHKAPYLAKTIEIVKGA